MTVPARRLRASLAESDDDFDEDFAAGEFYSGERVCPPPDGPGGIGLLRGAILILIALGGGWALLSYQATWRPWLAAGLAAVAPLIDPQGTAQVPAPLATASAAIPAPLPAATIIPTIQQAAVAPSPPAAPAATQSAVTTVTIAPAADEPIQQLPPPTIDPLDPYQKRAAAVGLHPQLSRVLLARLSPTDYRNAGVAIETAVAKTPDTATFVWPRQRTPELALFEVHFVPGAAPHCRRYVVTVTKDRWSTTAAPMEKCGTKLAGGKGK
jgi:hypothetical protein